MLKFKSETESLENEITRYAEKNANLSESDIQKLRDEIKYISSDLPVNERVARAGKIVFGVNPTDNMVYKQISVGTQVNGGNGAMSQISQADAEKQIQIDAMMKFLKLK